MRVYIIITEGPTGAASRCNVSAAAAAVEYKFFAARAVCIYI